jgi:hypothetical protein
LFLREAGDALSRTFKLRICIQRGAKIVESVITLAKSFLGLRSAA